MSVDFLFLSDRVSRGAGSRDLDKALPFESQPLFRQDALPVDAEADAGGIFQQPGSFLLLGELGVLPMPWMLRGEERFLTVKDRRVGTVTRM